MVTDESVVVDYAVPMRTSDGATLVSTVYRPSGNGRHPVLLTRLPYGRLTAPRPGYFDALEAARRGFVVIMQDVRGRGSSEGEFVPSVNEALDGFDAVEWAAGLPYSDGRVGMWGLSYFSETQLRAAATRPRGLRALALGVSAGGNANNGAIYRGGALETGSRFGWAHYAIASADPRAHADARSSWPELDRLIASGGWPTATPLDHPDNLFTDVDLELLRAGVAEGPGGDHAAIWDSAYEEPLDLPTLHIGGWCDIFLLNTLDMYRNQRAHVGGRWKTRLVIGPWAHTNQTGVYPDIAFGANASSMNIAGRGSLHDVQMRWFAETMGEGGELADEAAAEPREALSEQDSVVPEEDEPGVFVYVMGTNRWLTAAELPEPDARRRVHLGIGSRLLDEAEGRSDGTEFVSDPDVPVPTLGGSTMMPAHYLPGPRDQRSIESRSDVAVFTSEPVAEDTTIFGEVTATITVEVDAPDADLVVRLCAVDETGCSMLITDGISRLSQRHNLDATGRYVGAGEASPLAVGERVRIPILLMPTCWTLQAGQRLRVHVAGSSHPRWDVNPQNGSRMFIGSEAPRRASIRINHGGPDSSRVDFGVLDLAGRDLV